MTTKKSDHVEVTIEARDVFEGRDWFEVWLKGWQRASEHIHDLVKSMPESPVRDEVLGVIQCYLLSVSPENMLPRRKL